MIDSRIGFGYDVHSLVSERKLILGGVEIPYNKGLLGHSDADVLVHAICDALLGSLALGDIGTHFPDDEIEYKDISSLKLLETVNNLTLAKGYRVNNIDATIVAQSPKLSPYIKEMQRQIAKTLLIEPDSISIKAKTTEGLGFTGRMEGIAAYAVCSMVYCKVPA
ncbi:MAG: 2-C-methyl-D-erythritol 2,4-cyclodiphosphate synthase [Candidatus Tectomicrobia bacterium]|uniref:2-C-methyl-D-erythritol 2,4-cyclodiphosphate synthase n=1 Tax=Tectimicrobiota bacterium TaxID=2528274 RepID=A0A933LR79_UNCTE|nr:2-C-methyl-D-erythritol 2,4-cyclodiphosphate synthase [Candidatus Tectomicrobia bacterium]